MENDDSRGITWFRIDEKELRSFLVKVSLSLSVCVCVVCVSVCVFVFVSVCMCSWGGDMC